MMLDDKEDAPIIEGYKRFYGDVEVDAMIFTSPNGTKYRLTVSNAGAAVFTAI